MLLAIDAGNTNIVFAVYNGNGSRHDYLWRCQTDSARTADEYAAWLHQLFSMSGLAFGQIKAAIISSVVPDANFNLRALCRVRFGVEPLFVGQDLTDFGFTVDLERPREVGADRLVNAMAVLTEYTVPAIVIDFGTATTFDVVDSQRRFRGGVIAPGVNLSLAALHGAAAKLPKISIAKPQAAIGRDTVSAMQSGIYWGYVGLVESIVGRIAAELEEKPLILATGGLASMIAQGTEVIDKIDKDLTLRGLYYMYQRHLQRQAA